MRQSGGNVVGVLEGTCRHLIKRSRVEGLSRAHVGASIDRRYEVLARVMVVMEVDIIE